MEWRTIGWQFGVCVFCEVLVCRKYGRWYNERGYCYECVPELAKLEEEEEEKRYCYKEAFGWCHLCKPKKEEGEEEEEKDLDMMDRDGGADENERPWWYSHLGIGTIYQTCEYCRSNFLAGNCGTYVQWEGVLLRWELARGKSGRMHVGVPGDTRSRR